MPGIEARAPGTSAASALRRSSSFSIWHSMFAFTVAPSFTMQRHPREPGGEGSMCLQGSFSSPRRRSHCRWAMTAIYQALSSNWPWALGSLVCEVLQQESGLADQLPVWQHIQQCSAQGHEPFYLFSSFSAGYCALWDLDIVQPSASHCHCLELPAGSPTCSHRHTHWRRLCTHYQLGGGNLKCLSPVLAHAMPTLGPGLAGPVSAKQ